MKQIILVLIVACIAQSNVSGQKMEILKKCTVELKGNVYDFYESEDLFKKSPSSYDIYQKSQKAKKAGKIWGVSALGLAGVGIVLISSSKPTGDCSAFCLTNGQSLGVISFLFLAPIAGTVGIINTHMSKKRFKEAVMEYNSGVISYRTNTEGMDLSFGLAQNGVGFVLNF